MDRAEKRLTQLAITDIFLKFITTAITDIKKAYQHEKNKISVIFYFVYDVLFGM